MDATKPSTSTRRERRQSRTQAYSAVLRKFMLIPRRIHLSLQLAPCTASFGNHAASAEPLGSAWNAGRKVKVQDEDTPFDKRLACDVRRDRHVLSGAHGQCDCKKAADSVDCSRRRRVDRRLQRLRPNLSPERQEGPAEFRLSHSVPPQNSSTPEAQSRRFLRQSVLTLSKYATSTA